MTFILMNIYNYHDIETLSGRFHGTICLRCSMITFHGSNQLEEGHQVQSRKGHLIQSSSQGLFTDAIDNRT